MHSTNQRKAFFSITKESAQMAQFYEVESASPIIKQKQLPGDFNGEIDHPVNLSSACSINIATDTFDYPHDDQVLPIQPEQLFFMDYTSKKDLEDTHVLDIGLGSGVLSIFCLQNGAAACTGLEINPRAKVFAGYNAIINNIDKNFLMVDGDATDIFRSVADKKFGFICSNPPFEPTPPGINYYINSAAGIYGLDFVNKILANVDQHLLDDGVLQMVTMAPGTATKPFKLYELIEKHLPRFQVDIILDLQPIPYSDFVDRFKEIFGYTDDVINHMKKTAHDDGVTHLHMLILKYKKGKRGSITEINARKVYETWSSPLGAQPVADEWGAVVAD